MAKYHVKINGEPGICKAAEGKSPRGGSSGSENHFETKEEVEAFCAKQNEEKFGKFCALSKDR